MTEAMTDHARAIEAGARAIYTSKLLMQPREPWDSDKGGKKCVTGIFCMEAAKACIEAAIASGALVPASATKPYSSAEFLTSPEALDGYVKEMVASAAAEMRERCAAIIQAECDRILSKQTPTSDPFSDADAINTNLRMMAVILPDLVEKVRQLDTAPASGDYVVVPRHPTQDMIEAGWDAANRDIGGDVIGTIEIQSVIGRTVWTAMLNTASSNGGGSK